MITEKFPEIADIKKQTVGQIKNEDTTLFKTSSAKAAPPAKLYLHFYVITKVK